MCAAPCGREAAEEVLESSVAALGFAIVCSVSSKMPIDKFHLQRVCWQCSVSVWQGLLSARKRGEIANARSCHCLQRVNAGNC